MTLFDTKKAINIPMAFFVHMRYTSSKKLIQA